ncbi:hypothetical protein PHJA_001127900 [Phtheirospermum japonicum]|uniref:Uncharacterized protein n=1 Tax=Phtheirospermum japonicum TaxID=374723 RepID=A0A830C6G7_9LAMI|nr:hypothetical protein PHJA_001127900 [Phtheirospermum japonicum]
MWVLANQIRNGVPLAPGIDGSRICILDSNFFTYLQNTWAKLHPNDPKCIDLSIYRGLALYNDWIPSTDFLRYLTGLTPRWGVSWHYVDDVFLVCRVGEDASSHWKITINATATPLATSVLCIWIFS